MSVDFTGYLNSAEKSGQKDGRKSVFVEGDSMFDNVSEQGISKQHSVKVRNFPGATTEMEIKKLTITFSQHLIL